jgi:hypothetical protein
MPSLLSSRYMASCPGVWCSPLPPCRAGSSDILELGRGKPKLTAFVIPILCHLLIVTVLAWVLYFADRCIINFSKYRIIIIIIIIIIIVIIIIIIIYNKYRIIELNTHLWKILNYLRVFLVKNTNDVRITTGNSLLNNICWSYVITDPAVCETVCLHGLRRETRNLLIPCR